MYSIRDNGVGLNLPDDYELSPMEYYPDPWQSMNFPDHMTPGFAGLGATELSSSTKTILTASLSGLAAVIVFGAGMAVGAHYVAKAMDRQAALERRRG